MHNFLKNIFLFLLLISIVYINQIESMDRNNQVISFKEEICKSISISISRPCGQSFGKALSKLYKDVSDSNESNSSLEDKCSNFMVQIKDILKNNLKTSIIPLLLTSSLSTRLYLAGVGKCFPTMQLFPKTIERISTIEFITLTQNPFPIFSLTEKKYFLNEILWQSIISYCSHHNPHLFNKYISLNKSYLFG